MADPKKKRIHLDPYGLDQLQANPLNGMEGDPLDAIKNLGDQITGSGLTPPPDLGPWAPGANEPPPYVGPPATQVPAADPRQAVIGAQLGTPEARARGYYPASDVTPMGAPPEPAPEEPAHPMDQIQKMTFPAEGPGDKLRMAKLFGSSLDQVGRGLAGLTGKVHPESLKPLNTEPIDEAIDTAEDRLSDQERKMIEDAFGIQVPAGMRRSQIRQYLQPLSQVRATEASTERMGQMQDVRDRTRLETAFRTERGEALKDKMVVKLQEAKNAADRVLAMGDLNANPAAVRSAMVSTARAAGDIGVLTQRDIEAYEGKIGIPGFLIGAAQFVTGQYTPTQVERIKEVANEMQKVASEQLAGVKSRRIKSFTETNADILGRHGKTPEDVERSFEDIYGQGAQAPSRVTMVLPDGREIPDIDPSQVKRFEQRYPGSRVK